MKKVQGTVKWFNNRKGYGFITPSGGGEDVFVHHTAIQMPGYRGLTAGQSVEFAVRQTDKGQEAAQVTPINPIN